jgi:cytidylate kinase
VTSRNDDRIVTIDGLSGTGKTTLGTMLARRLQGVFLSSGVLYRIVGALCRQQQIDLSAESEVEALIRQHTFSLKEELIDQQRMIVPYVDGLPFSGEVYGPAASEAASQVARYAAVRSQLLPVQREVVFDNFLVAEGRDMGTVVFPTARTKFFVEVDIDTKLARGLASREIVKPGDEQKEFLERDRRDQERLVAPTVAAVDAILITNDRAPDTVVEQMFAIVQRNVR